MRPVFYIEDGSNVTRYYGRKYRPVKGVVHIDGTDYRIDLKKRNFSGGLLRVRHVYWALKGHPDVLDLVAAMGPAPLMTAFEIKSFLTTTNPSGYNRPEPNFWANLAILAMGGLIMLAVIIAIGLHVRGQL